MAVLATKQEAFDFIEKPIAAQRLVPAVHTALAFDRQQRTGASNHARPQQYAAELVASLTSREREVLNLVIMDSRRARLLHG